MKSTGPLKCAIAGFLCSNKLKSFTYLLQILRFVTYNIGDNGGMVTEGVHGFKDDLGFQGESVDKLLGIDGAEPVSFSTMEQFVMYKYSTKESYDCQLGNLF